MPAGRNEATIPEALSRRTFTLLAMPAAGLGALGLPRTARAEPTPTPAPSTAPSNAPAPATDPDLYPRQPLSLAAKVVGLAHRDLAGVRELVEAHPALANAAHDWGFGDWENPLGAAAHTGQTEIAEYLLSKGARPDIFALVSLGHLEAVKAIIEARPGVQRTTGPHGISLLRHAKAGGEPAKPVLDYLTTLGDADPSPTNLPVTEDIKRPLLGTYAYGESETQRLLIGEGMGGLTIKRIGGSAIRLLQQTPTLFVSSGAPSVRIAFEIERDAATSLTITDHDIIVTAKRTP